MIRIAHLVLNFLKNFCLILKPNSIQDDPIPDNDHILRYIKPTAFQDGQINGSEFLRKSDHKGTSVNWIECFRGNLEEQIMEIRNRRRIEYKRSGCLARLNVGSVRQHIFEETIKTSNKTILRVLKDHLEAANDHPEDPSHALITGVPSIEDLHGEFIGDLIRQCVIDIHPALLGKK